MVTLTLTLLISAAASAAFISFGGMVKRRSGNKQMEELKAELRG